jgi:hypothetical protein
MSATKSLTYQINKGQMVRWAQIYVFGHIYLATLVVSASMALMSQLIGHKEICAKGDLLSKESE